MSGLQNYCLELLPHIRIKRDYNVFEATIEESERPEVTGNRTQDTYLVQPAALPLSYDHWTTTSQPPANTILYIYCTGGTDMPRPPYMHIQSAMSSAGIYLWCLFETRRY